MPSLLVHLAVGGLVAAALLGDDFRGRTLAVVLAAAAAPDLDTVLGLWVPGGHRALLHSAPVVLALAAVVLWDRSRGDASLVRRRWGDAGVRTASVAVAAVALAGVAPDLFTNGVNVLYPLHDQFYVVDGEALLSTRTGFEQTFVELRPPSTTADGGGTSVVGDPVGSTSDTHYRTGVDPSAGPESAAVERTFTLLQSGRDLFLVLTGSALVAARLAASR